MVRVQIPAGPPHCRNSNSGSSRCAANAQALAQKSKFGEKYRLVSLFSGSDGLDLGFKQTARYEILFANDIFEHTSLIYSKNLGLKLTRCKKGKRAEASRGTILVCDVE